MAATEAVYDYQFDDIPAGEYYLIAGSDVDNNSIICEIGESCGAYPLRYQELLVTLIQNINGLDFPATINSGLSGTTGVDTLSTQQGFPVKK